MPPSPVNDHSYNVLSASLCCYLNKAPDYVIQFHHKEARRWAWFTQGIGIGRVCISKQTPKSSILKARPAAHCSRLLLKGCETIQDSAGSFNLQQEMTGKRVALKFGMCKLKWVCSWNLLRPLIQNLLRSLTVSWYLAMSQKAEHTSPWITGISRRIFCYYYIFSVVLSWSRCSVTGVHHFKLKINIYFMSSSSVCFVLSGLINTMVSHDAYICTNSILRL